MGWAFECYEVRDVDGEGSSSGSRSVMYSGESEREYRELRVMDLFRLG